MTSEGTPPMVVLAVDIIGNGTADRDVSRAGNDGEKPALRDRQTQQCLERHPRLDRDDTRLRVKGQHHRHGSGGDDRTAVIQTGITVTASLAEGQERRFIGLPHGSTPRPRHGLHEARRRMDDASPGRQIVASVCHRAT